MDWDTMPTPTTEELNAQIAQIAAKRAAMTDPERDLYEARHTERLEQMGFRAGTVEEMLSLPTPAPVEVRRLSQELPFPDARGLIHSYGEHLENEGDLTPHDISGWADTYAIPEEIARPLAEALQRVIRYEERFKAAQANGA